MIDLRSGARGNLLVDGAGFAGRAAGTVPLPRETSMGTARGSH